MRSVSLFLPWKHCPNQLHYSLGHFLWTLVWRVIRRIQMWWHGGGGGMEERKGNVEKHEKAERHGKHLQQHQRHTSSPWHCCLIPSLPANKRSVLWRSLQEAVGSQPRAGPCPHCSVLAMQGDWRLPSAPVLGPCRRLTPSEPEGTQLCSKQSQADCRAGWNAGCSNSGQVQLRACLYTSAESEDPRVSHSALPRSSSKLRTCFTWPRDIWVFPLSPELSDSQDDSGSVISGFRSVSLT